MNRIYRFSLLMTAICLSTSAGLCQAPDLSFDTPDLGVQVGPAGAAVELPGLGTGGPTVGVQGPGFNAQAGPGGVFAQFGFSGGPCCGHFAGPTAPQAWDNPYRDSPWLAPTISGQLSQHSPYGNTAIPGGPSLGFGGNADYIDASQGYGYLPPTSTGSCLNIDMGAEH